MTSPQAVVVGAGVFGVTAALELRRRNWKVRLLDQGPIPHPLAASTDISKVCRMEYGPDEAYMAWMETAREGWLDWNGDWGSRGLDPLYHETGVLMVSLDEMIPGGFEFESFRLLEARGHRPERIGGAELTKRFPLWSPRFVDGFFHAAGGFAESGRVIERLCAEAKDLGVEIGANITAEGLAIEEGRVAGVSTAGGTVRGEVVLTAGSWSTELLPELGASLERSYHPVWHLAPRQPERFRAETFPTFTADVARTGFYGFPLHPSAGVVKLGHHGLGVEPKNGKLEVPASATRTLCDFLAENLPVLAEAPVVATRLCPYCDTRDEDLWIARSPDQPGLTVATGGSGHAFKFAPVLGRMIADVVEGKENDMAPKFRWRPEVDLERGREAARCHEPVL